jgi:LmbE family N-acetylglucosaminyl deacetylase
MHAATGRRLGVVMTVERDDQPHPHIERTFTAVRAAVPAANVATFDTELEAITHAPVADLAAPHESLSGWLRIATRAAADPADWHLGDLRLARPAARGCGAPR